MRPNAETRGGRWAAATVALAALLACSRQEIAAGQGTGSLLSPVSGLEHPAGVIEEGSPISVDFPFRNASSEPVRIDRIVKSCGWPSKSTRHQELSIGAR